jgi:hypothetical protein
MSYTTIANTVDSLHVLILGFWIGGFILHPISQQWRFYHCIFGITVLLLHLPFRWRCPLTLLSYHLRRLAGENRPYQSFTIQCLNKCAIPISETQVSMIMSAGTAWMIWSLYRL